MEKYIIIQENYSLKIHKVTRSSFQLHGRTSGQESGLFFFTLRLMNLEVLGERLKKSIKTASSEESDESRPVCRASRIA